MKFPMILRNMRNMIFLIIKEVNFLLWVTAVQFIEQQSVKWIKEDS